jgi:hypothetical protein
MAENCLGVRSGFLGGLLHGERAFHFEALRLLLLASLAIFSRSAAAISLLTGVPSTSLFSFRYSMRFEGRLTLVLSYAVCMAHTDMIDHIGVQENFQKRVNK